MARDEPRSPVVDVLKKSAGNAVWNGTDASGDLLHAYLSVRMGEQFFAKPCVNR